MNFTSLSVEEFIDRMGLRKIPSPAAGSSLAVSFSMACSLLEMTLSELADERRRDLDRDPLQDLHRVRQWRQEGISLIDKDIRAVEAMIHGKGEGGDEEWLVPVQRLYQLGEEMMDLIQSYLRIPGPKISDTWVAFLQLRTVFAGSYHIVCFNESFFGWPPRLGRDWEEKLRRWDCQVAEALREVQSRGE
ncbi:cyclodeaminase/cyclohydrolase family protein [Paludifilum halophilum]|uniref:Cyclodeaminase/cyclohydrolase domain-containing protein n=1 Tax=Paludifilum halophilum TaxID=1642702 RepID=A0A235B4J9_9BACL|nr:cyclodeaminase/cyclohydrolase family protein [Paludifilum halophilum]OYD07230.1 hypothetical protein CHM34_12670 [Paludifilum halophilum]